MSSFLCSRLFLLTWSSASVCFSRGPHARAHFMPLEGPRQHAQYTSHKSMMTRPELWQLTNKPRHMNNTVDFILDQANRDIYLKVDLRSPSEDSHRQGVVLPHGDGQGPHGPRGGSSGVYQGATHNNHTPKVNVTGTR